jgi:hypothetical protein
MDTRPPVLDYGRQTFSGRKIRQRVFYCLGLPLIGFSVGYCMDHRGDAEVIGMLMGIGCLFVGLALPTQD